ncbi:MAG TPA: hypothetical protein VLA93_20945 [Pyrinomonadaceae bacterium]|nr:hypothetical protein [Pyrinomonadaceae bacterium]
MLTRRFRGSLVSTVERDDTACYSVPCAVADGRHSSLDISSTFVHDVEQWPSATAHGTE